MYESLLRPLLFRLDPEVAHNLALWSLGMVDLAPSLAQALRRQARADRTPLRCRFAGLDFPNPVGLGAGLDKNAEAIVGLFALGFGAVEVGTVTPRPQPGNDKPRVFRLPQHLALINRMGFNNDGADAMAARLRELEWRPAPIGVNLGKNKLTPLEEAPQDYALGARRLAHLSDYVVVNLSSPNTPNLRQLQEPAALEQVLTATRSEVQGRPLFLKIAPDLGDEAIDAVVDVATSCKVDGFICTNTTITRPVEHPLAQETGGLSGRPLASRSTEVIRRVFRRAQGRLPIIGVGGILDGGDAWSKICAGASMVQLYTGLVYRGPGLVRSVLDDLESKVSTLANPTLDSAIGRDA